LEQVGLTAGETEDFGDDPSVVLEGKFGVGMEEEIFGFVGFEVVHFHRDDADEVVTPAGTEFFEGLDSREEKAQSIVMLNHAAKLVE
jgi:metallophosphoesterase superfamily enzyme